MAALTSVRSTSSYVFSVDAAKCWAKHSCITACVESRNAMASSDKSAATVGNFGAVHVPNVIDSSPTVRCFFAWLPDAAVTVPALAEDATPAPLPAREAVTKLLCFLDRGLKLQPMPHHDVEPS